jgi:thiamine-phosphate pyrophosphorylase
MNWKQKVFNTFRLYAVTDLKDSKKNILKKIEKAYAAGVDIVQLRSKVLMDAELVRIGLEIRKIAHAQKKLFFVNDRLDIALALQADGLHIGQHDMPVSEVRKICKRCRVDLFLGKSTHSLTQAVRSAQEDVDYIGIGPIYATPTKKDYIPIGLSLINKVQSRVSKPCVAIGGIDHTTINDVLKSGAKRIAVVRAVFGSGDVSKAVRQLKRSIEFYER